MTYSSDASKKVNKSLQIAIGLAMIEVQTSSLSKLLTDPATGKSPSDLNLAELQGALRSIQLIYESCELLNKNLPSAVLHPENFPAQRKLNLESTWVGMLRSKKRSK